VNLKTAALRLGVHYQTAYRWVRSGQLVAVKVGAGYEVSDAAVERLVAQRTATGRTPEGGAERPQFDPASSIEEALHTLDLTVDAVTLDSTAVAERAARVIAEHLGDTVFVYRRIATDLTEPGSIAAVYAAHRDPVSEVAASTLGRDPRTSTNMVRRAVIANEVVCVAQVPQRELRRRLHPELHEHLHLSGCYSAMVAPIGATGALLVTRDLPGRPYGAADAELVESIAARVTRADERARSWTAAWEMRRRMVAAFATPALDGGCFAELLDGAASDEPMIAVLDLELRHAACNKAYAALVGEDATRLTGVTLRSLVRDGSALDEALAPVLLGEIDYRSVELEVLADRARVALHVGMVRRADATPRGVVLVAHPVPGLSVG
jgi:excisionase family DNA binding protein